MNTTQFNSEVLSLWGTQFTPDSEVLAPLLYPHLKQGGLLCVGMNPSMPNTLPGYLRQRFSNDEYRQLLDWRNPKWRNPTELIVGQVGNLESLAKSHYQFYRRFRDIAEHLGCEWEHVDLFFYRHRDQGEFLNLIEDSRKAGAFTEFGQRQLSIARRLIECVKPGLVLVANAKAASIFENEYQAKFDDHHGFHYAKIGGCMTPVFLSSMLTGQRALDNHSFKRLKWHMHKAWRMHNAK